VTGSAPATAATFASVAFPEMDRYHYKRQLSAGTVAVGGTLGSLIPPSVTLIVFGMITGAVDREAIFGERDSGTHHCRFFHIGHLRDV